MEKDTVYNRENTTSKPDETSIDVIEYPYSNGPSRLFFFELFRRGRPIGWNGVGATDRLLRTPARVTGIYNNTLILSIRYQNLYTIYPYAGFTLLLYKNVRIDTTRLDLCFNALKKRAIRFDIQSTIDITAPGCTGKIAVI